jgi:hypothetical protein
MVKRLKRILTLICTLLVSFSFLTGCESKKVVNLNSTKEMKINNVINYRNSYVGNNNAVTNILYNLPGGPFVKRVLLETRTTPYGIIVDYGIKKGSSLKQEDLNKYFEGDNGKKIFLNNATTLFILVKNVDTVTFNLVSSNSQSFSISRENLEILYKRNLREYAKNTSLWKTEVLDNTINSEDKVHKFFEIHKVN